MAICSLFPTKAINFIKYHHLFICKSATRKNRCEWKPEEIQLLTEVIQYFPIYADPTASIENGQISLMNCIASPDFPSLRHPTNVARSGLITSILHFPRRSGLWNRTSCYSEKQGNLELNGLRFQKLWDKTGQNIWLRTDLNQLRRNTKIGSKDAPPRRESRIFWKIWSWKISLWDKNRRVKINMTR